MQIQYQLLSWLGTGTSVESDRIYLYFYGPSYFRKMMLKKPKYPKKATDLPKVITKLDKTMLYRLHLSIELTKLAVIDTD